MGRSTARVQAVSDMERSEECARAVERRQSRFPYKNLVSIHALLH